MESETKKSVTVNVLGNEYLLKGSSSPEQIQAASEYVDNLLRKLLKTNSHVNQQKLLVLTCINLADELIKIKQDIAAKNSMRQMQIQQQNQGQKAAVKQNGSQQRIFQQNSTQQRTVSQQQQNVEQQKTVKPNQSSQANVQQNKRPPESTKQPDPNQQKPNQ